MRKRAFTLAEVLITLTIIGIIAALTIPNLMQKWQDHADVVKVKEAYSIMDNAIKLAVRENGELNTWNWGTSETENSAKFIDNLAPYLKIYKRHGNASTYQSSKDGIQVCSVKTLIGLDGTSAVCQTNASDLITLTNGIGIIADITNTNYFDEFGYITIDINGIKTAPNRWGYDRFIFVIGKDGLSLKRNGSLTSAWCSPTNAFMCSLTKNDNGQAMNGSSCGYWIMMKGNTDYKYKDVCKQKINVGGIWDF